MSEARLAASLDGPDGAPVLVLANPIGTHPGHLGGAGPGAAALGITDSRLTVIRGTSHLAPYQTPGPVTAAILGHLVG